jgi:hypothetical protein
MPGLLSLLALSSCGGGSHALPANSAPETVQSIAAAPATFTFIIPNGTASATASKRSAQWINAATQSIRVTLTDAKTHGTATDIFANVPAALKAAQNTNVANTTGNPNTAGQCGTDPSNAQNIKCTATVQMPVGDDTFLVTSWDGPNGTGNEISAQQPMLFVQQGQPNAFTFTLDALATTLTVTPPGSNVALSGTGCASSPISGASDLSSTCTATITGSSAVAFALAIKDAHGTVVPSGVPGAPALSVSSSNTANFTASLSGSTLTITPQAGGTAVISVVATPANSSGATPGDGLAATTLKFTVAPAAVSVTQFAAGYVSGSPVSGAVAGFLSDAVGADGTLYVAAAGSAGQSAAYEVTRSGGTTTWTPDTAITCYPVATCATGTVNTYVLALGVDSTNHLFGMSDFNIVSGTTDIVTSNVWAMAVAGTTLYYASGSFLTNTSPLTFYKISTFNARSLTGLPGTVVATQTFGPGGNTFGGAIAADANYIYAPFNNDQTATGSIIISRIKISDGSTTSYTFTLPTNDQPGIQSIAVDPTGQFLYAVDNFNNAVWKLNLSTSAITQIATATLLPDTVAVDSSGALYVTDGGTSPPTVYVVLNP